jgi:hypothetical protein
MIGQNFCRFAHDRRPTIGVWRPIEAELPRTPYANVHPIARRKSPLGRRDFDTLAGKREHPGCGFRAGSTIGKPSEASNMR